MYFRLNPWIAFGVVLLIVGSAGTAIYSIYSRSSNEGTKEPTIPEKNTRLISQSKPDLPKAASGRATPDETLKPKSTPATKAIDAELKKGLSTLDGIGESDPSKGVAHYSVKLEAETLLELICLHEVKRAQKDKVGKDILARIDELEKKWAADNTDLKKGFKYVQNGDTTNHTHYTSAYTQWYALLVYGLRNDFREWQQTGKALVLLDELKATTGKWSRSANGTLYVDGSIVTTALYVTLLLYTNTDWCGSNVGLTLDTPVNTLPENNPVKDPGKRASVAILENCCKQIDSYYSGGTVPASAGLKYAAAYEEQRSLVGGKVLYFIAKMMIAYEKQDPKAFDVYQEQLFTVLKALDGELIKQLEKQLAPAEYPIVDSYTYAYVVRALAISIRLAGRDGKSAQTQWLVDMGNRMIELKRRSEVKSRYSEYYSPLALFQYRNELQNALDVLERPPTPSPR